MGKFHENPAGNWHSSDCNTLKMLCSCFALLLAGFNFLVEPFFLTFWDLWFDFFYIGGPNFYQDSYTDDSRILQNKDLSLLLAYGFYLSPFRQSFVVDRLNQKGVVNVVQLGDFENIMIRLAFDVGVLSFQQILPPRRWSSASLSAWRCSRAGQSGTRGSPSSPCPPSPGSWC